MKKKNKSKRIIIILSAAFVLIIALIYIKKKQDSKGVEVTIAKPQRTTITESIPANGKIQPVTEVKISPDVSGEIIELNYKEGDPVQKGELLIKIKQDVYISLRDRAAATLNSTKAQYLQQKAQLRQIELNHKRNETLYSQKALSEQEFETSLSQFEVAKEQLKAAEYNIKSAEAALKEAEENLVKTTIYAPMTGTISKLNVEKGERVVGTSQMAGTEMLRIADLSAMEVLVDVNENDIIRLHPNDTSYIEVDAYPGRKFKGIVTQIANSSKNSGTTTLDQVTNFEVKVEILPESYTDLIGDNIIPFRPGMSASVTINTLRKDNILTLPLQSITVKNNSKESVFVIDSTGLKVKLVNVKTGIQDLENIEIIEGLTDSSKVVTGSYMAISKELSDGSVVSIKKNKK